jgi:hypothetical protein
MTVKNIRYREYNECAVRGNMDYLSWFLEKSAPFELKTKIYTLAEPEYKFWKSIVDPENGHIRIVDGTLGEDEKNRLAKERAIQMVKFRDDMFLFYVIVNIIWMVR